MRNIAIIYEYEIKFIIYSFLYNSSPGTSASREFIELDADNYIETYIIYTMQPRDKNSKKSIFY